MYEIRINDYNHVSGCDSYVYKTRYENINAAKRKLVELALEDENLYEEDSSCGISEDLMFARTEGRHNDYTEYEIKRIVRIQICKDKEDKLSERELDEMIEERIERNKTLTITVG